MKSLKEKLQEIKKKGGIGAEVAREALKYSSCDNEIKAFFSDLLRHGCQSGMIGGLIYYTDTKKFYDKFYDEIEDIRENIRKELGPVQPKGDLKNWYAWLGFEETARKIASELELET